MSGLALVVGVAALVAGAVALRGASRVTARVEGWWIDRFRGVQPDPWPGGVQEEDPDRPWGSGRPERADGHGQGQGPMDAGPSVTEAAVALETVPVDGRVSAR